MTLREEFERWARTVFNDCDVVRYQPENGGQYVDPEVRRTWAAYQAATERAAKCVPSNWCDSLLTGPTAVIPKNCDNRAIEALLRGIQDRIRASDGE